MIDLSRVIVVTGIKVTVTSQLALKSVPSVVLAVMVAVPSETPVTTPLPLTVATSGLLLVQTGPMVPCPLVLSDLLSFTPKSISVWEIVSDVALIPRASQPSEDSIFVQRPVSSTILSGLT